MSERSEGGPAGDRARSEARPEARSELWVVDRLERPIAVLVEDTAGDDGTRAVVEVAAELLGEHAVEGAVLRVPLGAVGEPVWEEAERDADEEEARLAAGEAAIERLKKRDPGGDVIL